MPQPTNKVICECGQSIFQSNLTKHLTGIKHINRINMVRTETKLINNMLIHFCPCGSQFLNEHKKKHNASLSHRNYKIYDNQVKKEQQELLTSNNNNFAEKYYNTVKYQNEHPHQTQYEPEYDDFKYYRKTY